LNESDDQLNQIEIENDEISIFISLINDDERINEYLNNLDWEIVRNMDLLYEVFRPIMVYVRKY